MQGEGLQLCIQGALSLNNKWSTLSKAETNGTRLCAISLLLQNPWNEHEKGVHNRLAVRATRWE